MRKYLVFIFLLLTSTTLQAKDKELKEWNSTELNQIFYTFSGLFIGAVQDDSDIALPEKLARDNLDYSLKSLKELDVYLVYISKNKDKLTKKTYENTILWGGAYLGEVILKNSRLDFAWADYEKYISLHENLRKLIEYNMTTRTLLVSGSKVLMPINKIARFIGTDSPEEINTGYYAQGFLE